MVSSQDAEIYVEFTPVGSLVKVTAVCSKTGLEATIQGPASAGQSILSHNAVQKLKYLINKNKKGGQIKSDHLEV